MTKITIPELERFENSGLNTIKAFLLMFGYEIDYIKSKYPVNSINNIPAYKTFLLEKLMHNIQTYVTVVEKCHDYIIASAILRILIDNIAIYKLIYHAPTKDEILLRHYLYILDGVQQELDIHSRHQLRKTDKITQNEYDALAINLHLKIENLNTTKSFCINEIKNLKIYIEHKSSIDKFIDKHNWKFKSYTNHREKYSWSELHDMLPSKHNGLYSDLCNHISQKIHGLSMSNLSIDTNDIDIYEPFSDNIVLILGFIHEFITQDFDVDNNALMESFVKSNDFHTYLSFCSEKHRSNLLSLNISQS